MHSQKQRSMPFFPFFLTAALAAAGCGADDAPESGSGDSATTSTDPTSGGPGTTGDPSTETGSPTTSEGETAGAGDATLVLSFDGLPDLGADFVYEGWLVAGGEAVAAGRFSIDENGAPVPAEHPVPADVAAAATTYVLTIEPAAGDDPAPSDTHVLAGDLADGAATLTVAHPAALGTDFADAAGTYILETPSSADPADYAQGIWWLDPSTMPPAASLTLPVLPPGWTYEGWVVGPNGPVSTGTFTDPAAADGDGAGPDAGPDPAPPFPGQDFVDPPQVLTSGYAAVISVEPVPDNGPEPFAIKPLVDGQIDDVMPPGAQEMADPPPPLPTGTVTVVLP